jgi:hypothetical protein
MVWSLCGVPGLNNAGSLSAHIRTGSETSVEQKSKQVTVASLTTPLEIYDALYSNMYFKNQTFEDQILNKGREENGMEIITISKRIADVILDGRKALLSDKNQSLILQNQRRYAVIMEQHHHCHPRS